MTADNPATIVGNLARGAARFGGRPLLIADGTALTYREFAQRVEGAAADLTRAGAKRGDRIAVCARNRLEYAVLIWGCARGGFILSGLPAHDAPRAWDALIDNTGPALVLADDEYLPRLAGARSIGEVLTGRRLPWSTRTAEPHPDDVYMLVHTSGTTGVPKSVMITHRATMQVAANYLDILALGPGDVTPIHLPFSYVSGHISQLNPIMLAGGAAVIMREFRPRTLIAAARTHRATILDLVPWMFTVLLRESDFTPERLPELRAVIFGGAPMPDHVLAAVRERFPNLGLFDVYGMSETAGMTTVHDAVAHASAGGMPAPGAEVRLSSDGELLVRGPLVTPGYWNNPQATTRALGDGWLHTGDRARIGADGAVTVHGRVDDMINRAGVKIAPEDVEQALACHPAVADAAAYGIPDGPAGQAVAAAVVLRPGAAAASAELAAWARERLPVHARPRAITILPGLPRNGIGKTDRRALRDAHPG